MIPNAREWHDLDGDCIIFRAMFNIISFIGLIVNHTNEIYLCCYSNIRLRGVGIS